MLQIINYSAKAVAVIGDTKTIKEQLKAMGGKFNPRLSCGTGWIFSAKKRAEIETWWKRYGADHIHADTYWADR